MPRAPVAAKSTRLESLAPYATFGRPDANAIQVRQQFVAGPSQSGHGCRRNGDLVNADWLRSEEARIFVSIVSWLRIQITTGVSAGSSPVPPGGSGVDEHGGAMTFCRNL